MVDAMSLSSRHTILVHRPLGPKHQYSPPLQLQEMSTVGAGGDEEVKTYIMKSESKENFTREVLQQDEYDF